MNHDPSQRHRHKREPRAKGSVKHCLTRDVLAYGADEAGFMADTTRSRRKAAREALDGTLGALGAGDCTDWPQEGEE